MLFDSHCHIQFEQYDADREELVNACQTAGVGGLCVGCDLESSRKAVEFADKHTNFWSSIGVHPTEWNAVFPRDEFGYLLKTSKKIVAIGETGLDYYRMSVDQSEEEIEKLKNNQQQLFRDHIQFAKEKNLPLIIHCRQSHEDVQKILKEQFTVIPDLIRDPVLKRGVLHCFSGTVEDAKKYLELGFYISFTGIITFAKQYDEVIHSVPLEKILIETDSPFLTPVPYRGKRNNPMYVEYVAKRISEIKNVSYEEVVDATWNNAKKLFSLS